MKTPRVARIALMAFAPALLTMACSTASGTGSSSTALTEPATTADLTAGGRADVELSTDVDPLKASCVSLDDDDPVTAGDGAIEGNVTAVDATAGTLQILGIAVAGA